MHKIRLLPIAIFPFVNALQAQSNAPPSTPQICQTPNHVMHLGVRHTEARGVGYQTGYSTLEGFAMYNRNAHFMPFIDLRGHVFDDGKFAGNAGVGGRTLLSSIGHVFGCYVYYDVRQSSHGLVPQQVSPGIELLGSRMEYRVNGYFPVGSDESRKYRYKFDAFEGNRILLKFKQLQVMTGGDAEI